MENIESQGFSFDLPKGNSSIIKVIGVGGGGNNALMHMYEKGIHGVDFIICNTDAQTLDNNPVANKVQLGVSITEGLGAGADPEVGEKAAIESLEEIKAALGSNTKMVFITAGMGGGTGTGAAPIIAKIAREMGILTIGIVTVPFSFEGRRRLEQADSGLDKLRSNVDSLIVINNDKLRQQFGNLGFRQGFSKADEVLTNAAKGMAEVITAPFTINIDFRDAKSVLQNSGTALMSTGTATGEKRAEEAVKKALDSPLLNDNKITGAKDVLLLIQSGSAEAAEATMDEIGLINDYIQNEAGNTANIIFGVGTDEELGDAIKVLVIATGFAKDNEKNTGPTEKIKISLEDFSDHSSKESPFRSSSREDSKAGNDPFANKSLFTLEDDEDARDISFQAKTSENAVQTNPKDEFRIIEKKTDINEQKEDLTEPLHLFSFEEEEDLQSFSFDIDQKKEPKNEQTFFSDEKPIEMSFFGSELTEIQPEKELPRNETPTTSAAEIKPEVTTSTYFESKIEEEKVQINKTEIESTEEGFTFFNKKVDDNKVQERRNKLKEFSSRYQTSDQENEFETIPAFKRKNISLDESQASEQKINNFLSENDRGQMQIRENRFLNKDVD